MQSIRAARQAAVLAGVLAFTTHGVPAGAATASGTLAVTALVLTSCTVTPLPLVFGTYSLGLLDSTTTIAVACTADVADFSVALGAGTGAGASTTARKLTSLGGGTLEYRLYSDSARTANWGDSGGEVVPRSTGTGVGSTRVFNVYGRIPANQAVTGGLGGLVYTDSVSVVVNY